MTTTAPPPTPSPATAPPTPPGTGVFRVLDFGPEGQVTATTGPESVTPPTGDVIRWIDLQQQDPASLEVLARCFRFHPLALEDCAHFDQRPKVEEYGEYLFVVTHGIVVSDDLSGVSVRELHTFLGDRYVVTVHTEPLADLELVWRRVSGDGLVARRGAAHLWYLVADAVVDSHFPVLDRISDRIEELEISVLEHPDPEDLATIFRLRRTLAAIRKTLSPQRDAFAMLAKRGSARIDERTSLYFRDVYDHLSRLSESIDTYRDLLGNTLDAYLSSMSNRTNEIMKSLTIMSAIFLPLAFVVGFFGQNFDNLPFLREWMHSDGLMGVMIGSCISIPLIMLLWFRRRGWW